MASNPRALLARVIERFALPVERPATVTPGYRASVPMRAGDYLAPPARWPLVWVTDISGWTVDPVTTQVSFTLTHGARYTSESAQFHCRLPYSEADLYDPKHGKYLVIHLPVESEAQVAAILAAARGTTGR